MIIYKATNKNNGKVYIGATTKSLDERIKYHIKDAFRDDRTLGSFQKALVKYGLSSFDFEEIERVSTKEEMYDREQYWIKHYGSTDNKFGYNLDSGGIYCKKSDSTKLIIGEKKSDNWKNKDLASKMMDGLQNATEKWKNICKDNRIKFICPQCGKILYLPPYEAKNKRFCSRECAKLSGELKDTAAYASAVAAEKSHERNLIRKCEIASDIIDWAYKNKNEVLKCKLNNITNSYKPLINYIDNKYGISDLRSMFMCFDVHNKKEFAKTLKNIVSEENIC